MRTAWMSLALLGLGCAGQSIDIRPQEAPSPARLFRTMTEKITAADSLHARVTTRTVRIGVPGMPDCVTTEQSELFCKGGRARLTMTDPPTLQDVPVEQTSSLLRRLARIGFSKGNRPQGQTAPGGATRERTDGRLVLMEFRRLGRESVRGEVAEKIRYLAIRHWETEPEVECLCTVWISLRRRLPIMRERQYTWKKTHKGRFTVTETFNALVLDPAHEGTPLALAR